MARGGGAGKGGGSRKGDRAPVPRNVMVSKKLSWLLRHGADEEGLKLGRGGYVNLADVNEKEPLDIAELVQNSLLNLYLSQLQNRNMRSLQPRPTLQEIKTIVAENAKQRFALIHISAAPSESLEATTAPNTTSSTDPSPSPAADNPEPESDTEPSHYLIRANQGHSLKLESGTDDLLTPITPEAGNIPAMVVHGTRRQVWSAIVASGGLKSMGRNHVHFATGVPASLAGLVEKKSPDGSTPGNDVGTLPDKKNAPLALSMMRETSSVLMFLDLQKAMDAGLVFYLSENRVVLCEGDERGVIGLELFERAVDRDGKVLLQGGVVVGQKASETGKQRKNGGQDTAAQTFPQQQTLPIRDKRPQDGKLEDS